jgi:hypothetical protein
MIDDARPDAAVLPPLATADLHALIESLSRLPLADEAGSMELIEMLERLKSASAAAQATLTASVATSLRTAGGASEAGIGAQVGLARHASPHQGVGHLRLADALTTDLPHTLAALAAGDISEHRARIIADETACLSAADRRTADRELADRLDRLGDRELREATRRITLRLDHQAAGRRARRAREERHVTGRMLPDGMARITAVLGAEHYAAMTTALRDQAARLKAAGDDRRPGQLKADILVQRVTGTSPTEATPVAVNLVVGTETLFGNGPEPGYVPGLGHLPAALCRDLVTRASAAAKATLRRLFVTPEDRELVAMESSSRTFDGLLGQFIDLRDGGICRTPWCDTPIRNRDHVCRHADGGATCADNGQGLCLACNLVKEEPGWTHWVGTSFRHQVGFLTPLGDLHHTHPPPMPGGPKDAAAGSRMEFYLTEWVLTA